MKIKVTVFLIFFLASNLFSQNIKSSLFNSQANGKEYVIATGEMVFINLLVYSGVNLFSSNSPKTSFEVFRKNLSTPWIFDFSSFQRNQIFHPYFGALYFTSGRANNLNFLESFLLSTAGSFMWETYLEGPTVSLNDFITTPTAGAITGEILHRLSFSFYEISPIISWILSPMDGLNQLIKDKRSIEPNGNIYSQNYYFAAGLSTNYNKNTSYLPEFGTGLQIVYNNPYGHTSKEFYDQFSIDLYYSYWPDNSFLKLNMDGLLFSYAIFPANNFLSTLGLSFDYDLIYASTITLSDSSLGICLKQSFGDKETTQFNYSLQSDYIFMGTSDLFYLTQNNSSYIKPNQQAEYTYKYGPELKLNIEYFNTIFGNLFFNSDLQYLFTYNNSTNDEKIKSSLLIFSFDSSYEYKVYKDLYIGIKDIFILKNEFNSFYFNNFEITNKVDLYFKINK